MLNIGSDRWDLILNDASLPVARVVSLVLQALVIGIFRCWVASWAGRGTLTSRIPSA